MGIAVADKATAGDLAAEMKALKTRQRGILKRRASQFGNGHLQNSWNICTDIQRQWLRRRPRRLFQGGKRTTRTGTKNQQSDLKQRGWTFFWYTLLPLLAVLCISCGITMWQNGDAVSKFMQRYSSQYQDIVHNKLNYCNRSRSLHDIFKEIRANVLNQDLAINQLEQVFVNQSSIQSIALIGSSGVGKTLTLRILLELYPWAENVQSLAWNDFDPTDDNTREQAVEDMLHNLAHCGRNLLVIDNLTPLDKDYVAAINAMLATRSDVAFDSGDNNTHTDLKHLTIIYVFNLNRLLDDELYDLQREAVQQLPKTTVINYRNFNLDDVEECMRHEAKIVGMRVDDKYAKEILLSADPKVSGCKTVRSKVLMYGELETDNDATEMPDLLTVKTN
ncbi:uncharacterized protein LOC117567868 [Drosophila albomicans]|uniref:Uncharacterized protein LOC117567868 n=1 Tax=Drosophila albomicans TaxID=7291 RepID=A0A6P8WN18_DROAB|nr:uncharacterized protein LOC117567868 [Drosophila albomicans]